MTWGPCTPEEVPRGIAYQLFSIDDDHRRLIQKFRLWINLHGLPDGRGGPVASYAQLCSHQMQGFRWAVKKLPLSGALGSSRGWLLRSLGTSKDLRSHGRIWDTQLIEGTDLFSV